MTTSSTSRLERVGELLTPMQAMLLEIREATKFGTLKNYVLSHAERPGWPAGWGLGEALPKRMCGRPESEVDAAISKSSSAIAFSWQLFVAVNAWLQPMLNEFRVDIQSDLDCERREDGMRSHIALTAVTDKAASDMPRPTLTALFGQHLFLLYATRRTVADIQEKYFRGQPFLMTSNVWVLTRLIDVCEGVARSSNDVFMDLNQVLGSRNKAAAHFFDPWILNLEEIENSSEALATATVSGLVTNAKADVLISAGKRDHALKLLAAFIRSEGRKRRSRPARARVGNEGPSVEPESICRDRKGSK